MININFAPNENWDDAWLSLKLLFQPWRWKNGEEIKEIKNKLLKILNVSRSKFYVLLFLSGRSALYNLLKSLNLKKGDQVLVQAFTCEAVILPIIALNLKPVYVDIELESFSMNPIDLEKKLSPAAKVLILQHTFGIKPNQREKIISIIKQNNLVLIEDIAHTIKISNINPPAGGQKSKIKKHFLLLSFGRSKSVSSVFGGAIVGINKKIMKKLENLDLPQPSYSFLFKCLVYKPIVFIIKLTYNIYIGKIFHKIANFFNLLIPEISKKEKEGFFDQSLNKSYPNALAVLLLHQLKKLDKINQNRQKLVNFYLKNLKKFYASRFTFYPNQPLIRFPLLVKNRDKIFEKMAKKGIILGKWYESPVAPKNIPLDRVEYKLGSCPVAEKICQQSINLPTNIKIKEAEKIISQLKAEL